MGLIPRLLKHWRGTSRLISQNSSKIVRLSPTGFSFHLRLMEIHQPILSSGRSGKLMMKWKRLRKRCVWLWAIIHGLHWATRRDDCKIHWFYTHWHLPTLQNGRMYLTWSALARRRSLTECSSLLFKQWVITHFWTFLNSHSYQVQHALKAWTTGEYVEPRGSANHFSADNYGDRTERKSEKGRTVNVLIRRATQYMPTVKALTKDHWEAIFTEISNILADNKPKRKRSRSASSRGSEAPKEEEAAQEYILVSDDDD